MIILYMVTQEDRDLKKYYPHSIGFHAYRGGINFDWGGVAYDVFKKEIGGPVHHYDDPLVEHAITKALGKRIHDDPLGKHALGNDDVPVRPNFPKEYMLTNKKYPIPGVGFADTASDIKILLSTLKIFIIPSKSFDSRPNDIFQLTPPSVSTVSEYSTWLEEPNMRFWSQQLNFAVWCATSGCGISYDMLSHTQIGCILRFHVLYTIRSILSQLEVPLPWDSAFVWTGTRYNHNALNRLCNEFGIPNNPDFRFKGESTDADKFSFHYTSPYKDSLTAYYTSTHQNRSQYNWFVPKKSKGLTKSGEARLNKSIEAYVYTILGSQVNTRSSILGDSGSAIETQRVFLQLFESSIIERDISKSIQRYQLAIQEAKVRLDLAISPGCWLLPSNLVINTNSIVGYNNKLLKATANMKFGVNDINAETKSTGSQTKWVSKVVHQPPTTTIKYSPPSTTPTTPLLPKKKYTSSSTPTHKNNLVAITIVVAGIAWYLFR